MVKAVSEKEVIYAAAADNRHKHAHYGDKAGGGTCVLKLVYIGVDTRDKHKHNNTYFGGFHKKIRFVKQTYAARP